MNQEKQRIAIAEACGIVSKDKWGILYKTPRGILRDCPDYLADLNAMHEAEKVLSRGKNYYQLGGFGFYLRTLEQICYQPSCVESTAAQRAEAFLRALGKWEDDK